MKKSLSNILEIKPKNYIILGSVLLLIGCIFCLLQEVNRDDETWFLQVINRFLSGEILYRDIFFGTTPLSVYLAGLFTFPFGAELIIIRLLLALYFVAGVLLSFAILKELKVIRYFSISLLLSFFAFSHPQSTWGFSGYNGLAKVFFLLCFFFTIKWKNAQTEQKKLMFLILASCFSGLCFSSKHNVGFISFFILLAATPICISKKKTNINKILKNFFFISVIFSLIVGVCLLPTFLQGGYQQMMDYAFWNKTRYINSDHCSYFLIPSHWNAYSIFIFLAPFLTLFMFILAYPFLKKEKNKEWVIVILFLAGSLLTLYPRPDNPQKMVYVPLALLSILYFWNKITYLKNSVWQKKTHYCLSALFLFCIIFSLNEPIKGIFNKTKKKSNIAHFKWIIMEKSQHAHWRNMKKEFLQEHNDQPIFFLSTHCGFYFLLFNLKNPLPYDYPIHPALGCDGEGRLLHNIQSEKIKKIYIDHTKWSNWSKMIPDRHPKKFELFMKTDMQEISFTKKNTRLPSCFQVYSLKP